MVHAYLGLNDAKNPTEECGKIVRSRHHGKLSKTMSSGYAGKLQLCIHSISGNLYEIYTRPSQYTF